MPGSQTLTIRQTLIHMDGVGKLLSVDEKYLDHAPSKLDLKGEGGSWKRASGPQIKNGKRVTMWPEPSSLLDFPVPVLSASTKWPAES